MDGTISRRTLLTMTPVLASLLGGACARARGTVALTVYKNAGCGCCDKWVQHMAANGFAVTALTSQDVALVKRQQGVPEALESCHTAVVNGYVIEGHVPADDVKRLLAQKPDDVIGLAVPGMPQSAPGMDLRPFQLFTVQAFKSDGVTRVFATHTAA